ncbi:MAG: redoxin domain-containing protein [Clostridia bacterium]|nr:redoxin domain-containing protein [Clostridia bacterium]
MKKRTHACYIASHRASVFTAVLLVFALAFTLCFSVYAEVGNEYGIAPNDLEVVGSDVSSMSTTDIHGAAVTGSVFSQKSLTVLHFFSTWSADCIRELAYMQHALNTFGANEIAVYGLLYEDSTSTPESCDALFGQIGITYNCLRLDSVLTQLVSVYPYIPQTFLVNSNGMVVDHFPGTFESASELEALIEHELAHPSLFHEVRFIDGHIGGLILEVNIANGEDAVPPTPPVHEGYEFSHWEGNYQNVTEDRTITAMYSLIGDQHIPGDINLDGMVTTADALIVLRHAIGTGWNHNAFLYGDVDGDGQAGIIDAILILRISLGLMTL